MNESPEEGIGPGVRVLVVEDDPVVQRLVGCSLSAVCTRVDVVSTGREALETLVSGGYDVVLMDLGLPDMEGVSVARTIRSLEAEGRVGRHWIVGMTGNAAAGEQERCRASGMDVFLLKPFRIGELREAVGRPWG